MIIGSTRRVALLILFALAALATACADDSLVGPTNPAWADDVPTPGAEPIQMVVQAPDGNVADVAPGTCPDIQVPAGQTLANRVFATGDQIYRWDGAMWSFVAPWALLYSGAGEHGYFGSHYAGPTWESRSGSRAVATVLERCAADGAAIPWLLLKVTGSSGAGPLRNVEYIQRVYTAGGLAPAAPGTFVGQEARVPYTAVYAFFKTR